MKNILVDNKSEAHLIKFLKSLPDNQIKQFYDAVEWTPYPVLVIKEFQRRFKPNDDEFVTKLLESVNEAKTKGQKIGRLAKLRGLKLSSSVRARAKKTVSKKVTKAKVLKVLKGSSDLNPLKPGNLDGHLHLATLHIPSSIILFIALPPAPPTPTIYILAF